MKTVRFSISGMHCDHCIRAVDLAIRPVTGVVSCDVSIGEAVVTMDDSAVSRGELMTAIRRAGAYDVTGFTETSSA